MTVFIVIKFGSATRDVGEYVLNRINSTTERQFLFYAQNAANNYTFQYQVSKDGGGAGSSIYVWKSANNAKHSNWKVHAIVKDSGTTSSLFSDGSSQT